MVRNLALLCFILITQAFLGQIDIVEGLKQFRQDAEMYNYAQVKADATEMFRSLGKLMAE